MYDYINLHADKSVGVKPDLFIACCGGGSNPGGFMGPFFFDKEFNKETRFLAAEASFYIGKLSEEDLKLHYCILHGYIPRITSDNKIMELISPDKIIAEIQSNNKRSLNGIRYILLDKAGSCINPDGSYQVQLDNDIVKKCINKFFNKLRDISNKETDNSYTKLWNRNRDIFSYKISKSTLEILEEFFENTKVPGQLKDLKLHHIALYA